MRSLIGKVMDVARNKSPVSYAPRHSVSSIGSAAATDRTNQMAAMGSLGTVFSIVSRTSTATAAPSWHMHRTNVGRMDTTCPVCACPGVALVEDHLALRIWNKPNDFYTRNELMETVQQHVDLTGEGYLLVEKAAGYNVPLGLWPVRPDRMEPVPSPEQYLVGWVYTSASGERVPLELDEVIQLRMPNPLDPYRGLGPLQSVMVDADSARYGAQWNRNFFLNDATPGGIIQSQEGLTDGEFKRLVERWNEVHQGVRRAHKVAILEKAEWKSTAYSMKDMQFTELRELSRDVIREAYGIPKFALGDVDDVNRANAEASRAWFAEQLTVPRLERFKGALNNDFLPMFGSTGQGVEFVYNDPTPPDREAINAERASKTSGAAALVRVGYDPEDVTEAMGLPPMRHTGTIVPDNQPAPANA